ncbi:MAG: hypothetical protein V1861_03665 [Candidatus Micrarchaeota archaeon]
MLLLTITLYLFSLSRIGFRLSLSQLIALYLIIAALDFASGQLLPLGEMAGIAYLLSHKEWSEQKETLRGWGAALVLSSWGGFLVAAGFFAILAVFGVVASIIYLVLWASVMLFFGEGILSLTNFFMKSFKTRLSYSKHDLTILVIIQALLFTLTGLFFGIWVGQTIDPGTIVRNAAGYYLSFVASTGIGIIPGVFEMLTTLQSKLGWVESPSIVVYTGLFQLVFFWIPIALGIPYVMKKHIK